jgi:hypothetical protein
VLHSEEEEATAHLEQQTSELLAEAERLFAAMPPACASTFVGDSLLSCHHHDAVDDAVHDAVDDGVDDGRHDKSRELVQHLRQAIAASTLPHGSEEAGWSATSGYIGRALVRSHPPLRACSSRGHTTHAMTA